MQAHDIHSLLLALGVLLLTARILGELANRIGQPSVLGELAAGILLGPTVLGALAPGLAADLFPESGAVAGFLHGFMTLSIVLFLLVAGMEVDLSLVWRQGRAAMLVGIAGLVFPFAIGFLAAWGAPSWVGASGHTDPWLFALFMGTVLSVSALPVIAKALMDLNVYRSDVGMLIIAAAVFNDLVGWLMFALILAQLGLTAGAEISVGATMVLTLLFAGFMLTLGRFVVDRSLPWLQAHLSWPGGVLGLATAMGLLAASFTEWIGVHAIFGSFLVGVAVGDSRHLREQTRATLNQFVSFIFAPLFFAGIGLKLDFVAHFDLGVTAVVLFIATLGKVVGCAIGGRLGGLSGRQAWAVGFGLNARGAIEIILGLLALQAGLIDQRLFISLVVTAIATSMMAGPAIKRLLRLRRKTELTDYLNAKSMIPALQAGTVHDAIIELTESLPLPSHVTTDRVSRAVLAREQLMPTGLGQGIAVPHARLVELDRPMVAVGLSREGIDFNAPDGQPARIIVMILTPEKDDSTQVGLLADVAARFSDVKTRDRVLEVRSPTEFRALLRTQRSRPV